MRCCSSRVRALRWLPRSEDASKTVQREVKATSSANSSATKPYRRMIGRFRALPSFELVQFEASDQRGGVLFRAQRVVEQGVAALGGQRRCADSGDVVAAVQRQA